MESPARPEPFSLSQWLLLLLLAAIHLTNSVDFLILMPLSTHLERDLATDTRMFAILVSSYGFAACLSGLLVARWLDRFDRKPTLLVIFAGLTLGTLLCAVAGDYYQLLVGRTVAGAFGGVLGAVVTTIVGDAFPPARRATAMGAVMSAFSLAMIGGVPAGLFIATNLGLGWRAPFYVLVVAGVLLLGLTWAVMPSLKGHLQHLDERPTVWEVMSHPNHLRAYALMILLIMSGFMIFPYISNYLTKNVGWRESQLPYVFIVGGLATLVTMNLIGRLADHFPRLVVFRVLAMAAVLPMLAVTRLPAGTSLPLTLVATTCLMVLASGRMVPAMTMITSSAEPRIRGSFLSINSSVAQLGTGLASVLSSRLLVDGGPNAPMENYPLVGLIGATFALSSVLVAGILRPTAPAAEEAAIESAIVTPEEIVA